MSTYGYDYSFAVPVDKVNKTLKDDLQHIDLELTYTDQETECGYMMRLNATMCPWQIIKGSQNSYLRFSIPLSKGKLDIEGPIPRNYDLANVTILIEAIVGWPGTGSIQQAIGCGDVSVVTILDPNNNLGTMGTRFLRNYIINALFENKHKINY